MIETTKKKQAALAAACVLSALLAVDGAQAGAGAGATAQPKLCSTPVCQVSVGYALPAAGGNDCSVKVPAAVLVPRSANSVEWTLVPPAGGGLPTHRFHPNRIRFDNNDVGDTPADGRNFLDDALPSSAQTDRKRLADRLKRRAKKAFAYTVSLQWRDAQGWHDCQPFDPMMINGD